jgi:hypothetical protein
VKHLRLGADGDLSRASEGSSLLFISRKRFVLALVVADAEG